MLYIKDNIIKDSSIITLQIGDNIIYNPSQSLLEENGWVVYNDSSLNQFINKRYIETTSSVFDSIDKYDLTDSIVFVKDTQKIYLNGIQYAGSLNDIDISYTPNDISGEYNLLTIGNININGVSYSIEIPVIGYSDNTSSYDIMKVGTINNIDGSNIDINIPISNYTSLLDESNGDKIGEFQFAGETQAVYVPKSNTPSDLIIDITYSELKTLRDSSNLVPGVKYRITDYVTTIDSNLGKVVYNDGEENYIIVEAYSDSELLDNSQLISNVELKKLEPTGDFELIAYKCDWNPDNECYREDYEEYGEYYKYLGDTIVVDDTTYYVWHKFENGRRLYKGYGKATIVTTSLDFECSIDNPYPIEYFINYDDTIKEDYNFEDPEETGNEDGSDSISRVVRVDKPVYNYHIKMVACDWFADENRWTDDEITWYEYNGDTIDIDNVTYFIWNKNTDQGNNDFLQVSNIHLPLTTTLYFDCSIDNPYIPEYWMRDEDIVNDYFIADEENRTSRVDVFGGVIESNLPSPSITTKIYKCDIKFDLDKGITYMKDEFRNEAPYDFKHIKFNDCYTFGTVNEDYSLDGFNNGVYNNIIMKPLSGQYNRICISSKNVYGNTFYPSCEGCKINFSIKESLISKSEDGLHIFNPKEFITPIAIENI